MFSPIDDPSGLAEDILWSDPCEKTKGFTHSSSIQFNPFSFRYVKNNERGCAYMFGEDAVLAACDRLGIKTIIRAHQVEFPI